MFPLVKGTQTDSSWHRMTKKLRKVLSVSSGAKFLLKVKALDDQVVAPIEDFSISVVQGRWNWLVACF